MHDKRPQNTIEVYIRTSLCVQSIRTIADQTVWGLRALVGAKFEIELGLVVLVFGGKILCDVGTLSDNCIVDGVTVHMVVNMAAKRLQQQQQLLQRPLDSDVSTSSVGGLRSPIAAPHLTLSSSVTLLFPAATEATASNGKPPKSTIATRKSSSTSVSAAALDKPAEEAAAKATGKKRKRISIRLSVRDILSDPDVMRMLVFENPRMQRIMTNFPHVRHILNSDSNIREMTNTVLNPARMAEIARRRDLSLMRVEAMPGGTALLHRLTSYMSDPFELAGDADAAQSSISENQTEYINPQLGKENRTPLPTSWLTPRRRVSSNKNSIRRACCTFVSKIDLNNPDCDRVRVRWQLTHNRASRTQTKEKPASRTIAPVLGDSNVNCNLSLDEEVKSVVGATIVDDNVNGISGENVEAQVFGDTKQPQQQQNHKSDDAFAAANVVEPNVVEEIETVAAAAANETSEISDELSDGQISTSSTTSVQSLESAATSSTAHFQVELTQMRTTSD